GLRVDVVHVINRRADVFGNDVAATKGFDRAAHGLHKIGRLQLFGIANDDRLAAAERQAGDGSFVGHAAGKAEDIAQRLLVAVIRPHAAAAERGAEVRVVHSDDGLEAGLLALEERYLLVIVEFRVTEYGHTYSSFRYV